MTDPGVPGCNIQKFQREPDGTITLHATYQTRSQSTDKVIGNGTINVSLPPPPPRDPTECATRYNAVDYMWMAIATIPWIIIVVLMKRKHATG